jgi:hypothetical protein
MSSRVTEARGDKRESLTNNFGIFRHAGILKWTAFTKQSGKRVMRFGAYYTQNDGMAVSGSPGRTGGKNRQEYGMCSPTARFLKN